jgi:hypothetical protein
MAIRGKEKRGFEPELSFCIQYTKSFFCQAKTEIPPISLIFVYDSAEGTKSFPAFPAKRDRA